MRELNTFLKDRQIGSIYPELIPRTLSLYLAGKKGAKISYDLTFGESFEYTMDRPNVYLHLETVSAGMTFYKSLLQSNRIEVLFLGGFRFTSLEFDYNENTNVASSFDTLVSNPSGNASVVNLKSASEDLHVGGRFQYRLGKKENLKPREYRIGIDSGYVYSFRNGPWWQAGNKLPVPAMPRVESDHFYLQLTFSGFFKI